MMVEVDGTTGSSHVIQEQEYEAADMGSPKMDICRLENSRYLSKPHSRIPSSS